MSVGLDIPALRLPGDTGVSRGRDALATTGILIGRAGGLFLPTGSLVATDGRCRSQRPSTAGGLVVATIPARWRCARSQATRLRPDRLPVEPRDLVNTIGGSNS